MLLLLAFTLIGGHSVNNARRWIRVGGWQFQPSEFFKVAVLLYAADRFARRERATSFGHAPALLSVLIPVGAGVVLILREPDLGTSGFVASEMLVLLGLAGVRRRAIVPYVLFALPAILVYAWTRFAHVKRRIMDYASGHEAGTQVAEALVAIGSGGLLGVGLGRGTQKLHWIAESHTDFIFAIIGEELGFLGCTAIIAGFMGIVWFGRRIAWAARAWIPQDPFPFYVAAGATFIVTFQALVNIAVVTATAPTKGISLPFISVGGSNLVMSAICMGPARQRRTHVFSRCDQPRAARMSAGDTRPLRIALAGGGTVGHLGPGFAIADALEAAGHEALFFTPGLAPEAAWFEGRAAPRHLAADRLPRRPWGLPRFALRLRGHIAAARKAFAQARIDGVLVLGGWPCVPALFAAGAGGPALGHAGGR